MIASDQFGCGGDRLRVFGYGSLLWKPGFEFSRVEHGYVEGWVRRFWQGNDTHRGTPERGITWGAAYELIGEKQMEAAQEHLDMRECEHGYTYCHVPFKPADEGHNITCLVFIATEDNNQWFGDAPLAVQAAQIIQAAGSCGTNVEYVLRLAQYTRDHMPGSRDNQLDDLEDEICRPLCDQGRDLASLLPKECCYDNPRCATRDSVLRALPNGEC